LRRRGAALDRSFSPHVTLLYRKGRAFVRPVKPIAWRAAEFVLIHSEIGRTRYRELGRWPLVAVQGSLF
jgi:2'-5' RNA ligase